MTAALPALEARLRRSRGVLVDSDILLDVATQDPCWALWSTRAMSEVLELTSLVINPIIYAEVSVNYTTIEALDAALPSAVYRREALPWEAGFLAGKCFSAYRRRGGTRGSPLPDFYIGAHAAIAGLAILTRDAPRYRSYYPGVEVLSPGSHIR
jgi:predicted nucleic acid-binding protein